MELSRRDQALVASVIPYFLEKGSSWFEKNEEKILESRRSQSFFEDNTLFLEKGQKTRLSELVRRLDEMGYEKVYQVQDLGEFSQRGGILTVSPINLDYPIRIEFWGNRIEALEKLSLRFRKKARELLKKKLRSQKVFSDLKGLRPGNYLVHLDHGIGQFLEIGKSEIQIAKQKTNSNDLNSKSQTQDYYILEYAQGDKLYVPLGLERKLSRYVGFVEPKISRLGSPLWQRTKRKIKEETRKLAQELLQLYAQKEISLRPPFLSDPEMDAALAASFPYELTPDQVQTIEEIEKDLSSKKPMDRLVCGDVGFGKTEIALRAMVKATNSGYLAALICPTTILANQHFQNFKKRLKNLPLQVGLLSRLQSNKEQEKIIKDLRARKIDIIIGTHRLLSKDIVWPKELGLLIIDDEHRFGVRQKEKLRKMRTSLDVLSLSATPIPRTLYLALSSLKGISLIQTPPFGRLSIKTFVGPWSQKTIKKAIEKELARAGQVYYLHNRIGTIDQAKEALEKLLPGVGFGIAHGQMREKDLVKTMADFQAGKINVLIATTIIEAGLDLPNVNTLIVADSSRLGLGQSYQIRGRIGRSHRQAFAYFLYQEEDITLQGRERLRTLRKAKALGLGYQIALKDLEMRGAGNILGKEQSGHINAVGLNLYCQMLAESIEKMRSRVNRQ